MSKELQEIIDIEREDAIEENNVKSIKNIMEELGLSIDHAMKAMRVPENEYEKYRKLVLNPSGMA